jgi:hypothetical protein
VGVSTKYIRPGLASGLFLFSVVSCLSNQTEKFKMTFKAFNGEIFWSVLAALCVWEVAKFVGRAAFVIIADRI